jgi:hypothetical protein
VVSECSGEIVTALTVTLAEAAAPGMITAAAVAAAAQAVRIAFLMMDTSFLSGLCRHSITSL